MKFSLEVAATDAGIDLDGKEGYWLTLKSLPRGDPFSSKILVNTSVWLKLML